MTVETPGMTVETPGTAIEADREVLETGLRCRCSVAMMKVIIDHP
jgi:hypothetical protein